MELPTQVYQRSSPSATFSISLQDLRCSWIHLGISQLFGRLFSENLCDLCESSKRESRGMRNRDREREQEKGEEEVMYECGGCKVELEGDGMS